MGQFDRWHCADRQLPLVAHLPCKLTCELPIVNNLVSRMQTFKRLGHQTMTPLLFILPVVCGMGHAQPQDAYTGEYSLNIPADAGFGNNFNLVTFPDHAPQTQQAEQYDVSLLQQQQQQAQQRFQPQAQLQRLQPTKQTVQPQGFQQAPRQVQQRIQPQVQQAPRFQAAPTRPSTDAGRFTESRRPEPQHQGGFSNFPARTPAAGAPTGSGERSSALAALASGERNSAPSFAAQPVAPVFRPASPTSPPPSVQPENTVLDYDYDPELSRFQLFKLRQKAKLAAQEVERNQEERSPLVKVVKRKKIQG